jgi:hypothetical protein
MVIIDNFKGRIAETRDQLGLDLVTICEVVDVVREIPTIHVNSIQQSLELGEGLESIQEVWSIVHLVPDAQAAVIYGCNFRIQVIYGSRSHREIE